MRKLLVSVVMLGLWFGVPAVSMAALLPASTTLTITAGVGGGSSTSMPGTGSKFSMDAFGNGNLVWTVLSQGSQTGIIIGTTQSNGGQMSLGGGGNSTPGQIDAAWKFFGSYGTDFTYATALAPSGATANTFIDVTCTGWNVAGTACDDGTGAFGSNGETTLGSWNVAWNGTNSPDGVPMGGGLIDAWIVSGTSYSLDYRQTVPSTSPAFPGVPYGLHLEGSIVLPPTPTPTNTPAVTATKTPTPGGVLQGCSSGYWKKHTKNWPSPYTTTTLGSVFNVGQFTFLTNITFLKALDGKDGKSLNDNAQKLMQQAVAGLLNAADPGVNYPLSPSQVISEVNTALASADKKTIQRENTRLGELNNLGCPLGK